MWTKVPNVQDGTQFFTRVRVLENDTACMLDGGSMVNTITEDWLVNLINRMSRSGIRMKDPQSPIVQLEKWPEDESVRGVAGGKVVPLVGAVVLKMTMCEHQKNTGKPIMTKLLPMDPPIGLECFLAQLPLTTLLVAG